MLKKLSALAALLSCLALTGCAAASAAPARPQSAATASPASPGRSTQPKVAPAASAIVSSIWVDAYPGSTFTSTHGCGCTLPGAKQELFPAGTPVLLVKVTLTGMWTPAQHRATTQDVRGTTLTGTKFDGRPEQAVLDTADGPSYAAQAGLPWLPAGLFSGHHWTITNGHGRSFAAAWYLPPGVDQLLLTVDIPAEGQPTALTVPLPPPAVQLSNTIEERTP